MFRGHEDDVFKGAQPNLFCNHYYWYEQPEARWPDKIAICNKEPLMYCSDSYYCNWTNNPQIWSIAWWRKEWIEGTLKTPNSISPYADVEYWTNWDYDAWNNKKCVGNLRATGAGSAARRAPNLPTSTRPARAQVDRRARRRAFQARRPREFRRIKTPLQRHGFRCAPSSLCCHARSQSVSSFATHTRSPLCLTSNTRSITTSLAAAAAAQRVSVATRFETSPYLSPSSNAAAGRGWLSAISGATAVSSSSMTQPAAAAKAPASLAGKSR